MHKICIVSTVELPIVFFMLPHIKMLQQYYDLTIIVNTDNPHFLRPYGIEIKVIPVRIERKISLIKDLKALFRLISVFRENNFYLIHSIAPKAGLLAMLAGTVSKVPIRVHCFTGQVWANTTGLRRFFLKMLDWIVTVSATHLLTDSRSQRDYLLMNGIAGRNGIDVLADGSVSGVDVNRFKADDNARKILRRQYEIPQNAVLFLFLGRLTKDKGVIDLAEAFSKIVNSNKQIYLMFVGPDEEEVRTLINKSLGESVKYVRFAGYTKTAEKFMAAADVLCLPSYREGFGMVIIEAASVGIPSITSRIYGVTDAVVEGSTGLLHRVGDIEELVSCMNRLADDDILRNKLGVNAQKRVEQKFTEPIVVAAMRDYYKKIGVVP